MKNKAFSFVELVIGMMIIGILAVIVVPTFISFREEALEASEEATVVSIKSGLQLYALDSALLDREPVYPPVLDTALEGEASSKNPFFTTVLHSPVTDKNWSKTEDTLYETSLGNSYRYDPEKGSFDLVEGKTKKEKKEKKDKKDKEK